MQQPMLTPMPMLITHEATHAITRATNHTIAHAADAHAAPHPATHAATRFNANAHVSASHAIALAARHAAVNVVHVELRMLSHMPPFPHSTLHIGSTMLFPYSAFLMPHPICLPKPPLMPLSMLHCSCHKLSCCPTCWPCLPKSLCAPPHMLYAASRAYANTKHPCLQPMLSNTHARGTAHGVAHSLPCLP